MIRRDENVFVRHCVEASNVDDNSFVIDPSKIRHVALKAGRIDEISGYIDPLTHLNLDFSDHKVDLCIISESFEKGAKIEYCVQGFAFALVPKTAFKHLGFVDSTQRILDMKASIRTLRESKNKEKSVS